MTRLRKWDKSHVRIPINYWNLAVLKELKGNSTYDETFRRIFKRLGGETNG